MNRCSYTATRRALLGTLLSFAALATQAETLDRPIPPKAQRAMLVVTQPPNILLNGQPDRLSPGARIRGTNNLLVLSGSLVGQNLLVRYLREPQGQVHEVWILTAAEAQQRVSAPQ